MTIHATERLRAVCELHGFALSEATELSELRATYLTGSDISILSGLAPPIFGTPDEVLREKIFNEPRKFRETRRMQIGNVLESFMACEYVENHADELKAMGVEVIKVGHPVILGELHAMATTDLMFLDLMGNIMRIVEIKTTGEDCSLAPPDRMRVQCAWQHWVARKENGQKLFPSPHPIEQVLYIQQDLDPPKLFIVPQDDTVDAAFETLVQSMLVALDQKDPDLVALPDMVPSNADPGRPKNFDKYEVCEENQEVEEKIRLYLNMKAGVKVETEGLEDTQDELKKLLELRGKPYLGPSGVKLGGSYRANGGGINYKAACLELLDHLGLDESAITHHKKAPTYSLTLKAEAGQANQQEKA